MKNPYNTDIGRKRTPKIPVGNQVNASWGKLAKPEGVSAEPQRAASVQKIFSGILLLTLLSGCSLQRPATSPSIPPASSVPRVSVAATFYPWAFFLRRIGGEHVVVRAVVPTGTEPHEFEPTPDDIIAVRQSRLFVYNGAGMDAWAEKVAADISDTPILTLRASSNVPLLDRGEEDDHHGEEEGHEDADDPHDPHFWLDPVLVGPVIDRLALALSVVDVARAEEYKRNAGTLRADLEHLDGEYRSGLGNCRLRKAVTSHAAFAYLAKRYGFEQIPLSGISPDVEPSVDRMREITDLVRAEGIRWIFFETLVSSKLSETIARETGAQTLVFNPLEGLTAEEQAQDKNYFSVMRENLTNLKKAMECG